MSSLDGVHHLGGADHATIDAPATTAPAAGPASSSLADVEGVARRRSAIGTQGSPRSSHGELPEASKRARTDEPQSGWPASRVDTSQYYDTAASRAKFNQRPERAKLGTQGRECPVLTPQTLGHYFKEPVGVWPGKREKLVESVIQNLKTLGDRSDVKAAKQLRREITLHWHALAPSEQSDVLDKIGQVSKDGSKWTNFADKGNVKDWLEHTAAHMEAGDVRKLLGACGENARKNLAASFERAGTDDTHRASVKEKSADMRMTLPLDHMYDYSGFYWDNKRKVGTLAPEVASKLKVCVVGAGPAGLMAADALNRVGVKPTVLEAEDHIGGRLASRRRPPEETGGAESPTATHPGGMRFHTTHGNFYWSMAKNYDLKHIDFTNPSQVGATLLVGEQVLKMEPGKEPTDPVLKKVKDDFNKAMDSLTAPLRHARDAGDTAKFRELSDAAKKTFDPLKFKDGVEHLLKENGIKWSDKEWETFGAVGIGVGGYKGYYNTGFLEEMRFLVDERLEGHQLLVDGADAPLKKMIADKSDLPAGTQSLEEQKAIKLDSPVTGVEKTPEGKYKVTWQEKGKEPVSETYDEVFFGAGPQIAVKLKMTEDRGDASLVSRDMAVALESANIVGATKMTMTVPADQFKPETLPKNLQSTEEFQQLYLHPPAKEGNNAVVYLSYTLGDNAAKVKDKSMDEQIAGLVGALRTAASRSTTGADDSAKLNNLADLIETHKSRAHYTHWSNVETQGGAFKMDAPGDLQNTRELYAQTFKSKSGLHFINEEVTAEAGFASGAFAAAVNAVQNLVVRHNGKLPPNSPYHQEVL